MTKRRRRPGPVCTFCARTIDKIGGHRITWATSAGVIVRSSADGIGNLPARALLLPLPPPYQGSTLVVWPPNSDALDRALEQWVAKDRPWVCQVCAQRVCGRCGSPQKHPRGCDIVTDDGRVLHVPLLPCPAGCTRAGCTG